MTSILFVDDDRRVLSGLRRQLHGGNPEWELSFAPGGPEGIAALDDSTPDVVVTDMKMPMVDGAQLLQHAVDQHPTVARLVLSGEADPDRRILAESCAHRYLVKPCTPDLLKLEVLRAAQTKVLMETLDDPRVRSIWSCAPASVSGGRELLGALVSEAAVMTEDVLALLAEDTTLMSRLRQALTVLEIEGVGLDSSIEQLCVAAGARTLLTTMLAVRWLEVCDQGDGQAWSRAVQTAVATRQHAANAGADPGESFLAGLLYSTLATDRRPQAVAVLSYALPVWGMPQTVVDALGALSQAWDGVAPELPAESSRILVALISARIQHDDEALEALQQALSGLQPQDGSTSPAS
jgi:CheY-like chemotaxis protein